MMTFLAMAPLDELYREAILEHNRNPRFFGPLTPPCEHAQGFNALCGDKIDLYFRRDQQHLTALTFSGVGCALSQASASMLCAQLQGAECGQIEQLTRELQAGLNEADPDIAATLPDSLRPLLGARRFPSRTQCVLLPWQTLVDALQSTPPAD